MRQGHDQRHFVVRMEWGLRGAEVISQQADYAVIVDVLSFTTTVSVALDQGAEVFPYPWQDESAQEFARQHGAILAVGRSEALSCGPKAVPADGTAGPLGATSGAAPNQHPVVSLSPASVRAASGLDRIVLPSPNGSALATALARPGRPIVAACLRNRTA